MLDFGNSPKITKRKISLLGFDNVEQNQEIIRPSIVRQSKPTTGSKIKLSRIIDGWIGQEMAMDLGTANTLIHIRGQGIVLNEPSVVAISEEDGKPIAVGRAAKDMFGKTSRKIRCIRPMKDGVIADYDINHLMIKDFITRVSKRWHLRRPKLIVSIPSGVTMVEKRAVIDAAMAAGARTINLIEEPRAAAIGSGMHEEEWGGKRMVE